MTTVDLREKELAVQDLLRMAKSDSVLIIAENGQGFTLEEADEFEKEVAMLGSSKRFMSFLEGRGEEEGTVSLGDIERRLAQKRD